MQPIILSSEETVIPVHKHNKKLLLSPNNKNGCQVSLNDYFIKLNFILVLQKEKHKTLEGQTKYIQSFFSTLCHLCADPLENVVYSLKLFLTVGGWMDLTHDLVLPCLRLLVDPVISALH